MSALLDREGMGLVAVAVLAVIFLGVGAWFLYHPPQESAPPGSEQQVAAAPRTTPIAGTDFLVEISYPGRDGATVLDLLKEQHRVRLDSELALFGAIVLDIDSFAARPDEFWIFYRDSLRGDRPPDICTTRTGESIRWVLKARR